MVSKPKNTDNERYTVHWDQEEPWTGDPYPFPKSQEFPTKAKAINFAKELKDDKNSLIDKYSIKVTYDYRVALDPKKYRYPYEWKSEKIKWE